MHDDSRFAIVPAAPEDIPVVAALAATIWRQHYPGIISDAQIDYMLGLIYSREALAAQIGAEGRWLDLAMLDGLPIGFVNAHLAGAAEIKLDKLYLLKAHHGRGFGSRLIAHVAAIGRAHGCVRIALNVNKHNASSIRIYARNGFRVRESVTIDIGQGFVMDDYVMEREIAAEAAAGAAPDASGKALSDGSSPSGAA